MNRHQTLIDWLAVLLLLGFWAGSILAIYGILVWLHFHGVILD